MLAPFRLLHQPLQCLFKGSDRSAFVTPPYLGVFSQQAVEVVAHIGDLLVVRAMEEIVRQVLLRGDAVGPMFNDYAGGLALVGLDRCYPVTVRNTSIGIESILQFLQPAVPTLRIRQKLIRDSRHVQ